MAVAIRTISERAVTALSQVHDGKVTVFSDSNIEGAFRRKQCYLRLFTDSVIGTKFALVPLSQLSLFTILETLKQTRQTIDGTRVTLDKIQREAKMEAVQKGIEAPLYRLIYCPDLELPLIRCFEVFYLNSSDGDWRVLLRFTLEEEELGRTTQEHYGFIESSLQLFNLMAGLEELLTWTR